MGAGIGTVGIFLIFAGIAGPFVVGGTELLVGIPIGIVLFLIGMGIENDDQVRHTNDYGRIARCPKCGSTKVYAMTYDDKRASISFWGAASSKIGKRFHCDNCHYEW